MPLTRARSVRPGLSPPGEVMGSARPEGRRGAGKQLASAKRSEDGRQTSEGIWRGARLSAHGRPSGRPSKNVLPLTFASRTGQKGTSI